jgi:hypothetical protein
MTITLTNSIRQGGAFIFLQSSFGDGEDGLLSREEDLDRDPDLVFIFNMVFRLAERSGNLSKDAECWEFGAAGTLELGGYRRASF